MGLGKNKRKDYSIGRGCNFPWRCNTLRPENTRTVQGESRQVGRTRAILGEDASRERKEGGGPPNVFLYLVVNGLYELCPDWIGRREVQWDKVNQSYPGKNGYQVRSADKDFFLVLLLLFPFLNISLGKRKFSVCLCR